MSEDAVWEALMRVSGATFARGFSCRLLLCHDRVGATSLKAGSSEILMETVTGNTRPHSRHALAMRM